MFNVKVLKMQFKSKRIGLRLDPDLREKAEKLVESGKFRNLSELVREAIREKLEKLKAR